MGQPRLNLPIIKNIVHCSDFSADSHPAFLHALKAALMAQSPLTILNVANDQNIDWTEFPGVSKTLQKWKLLPKNSPKSSVKTLGINVSKIRAKHTDPVKTVLQWLEMHPTDLLVLATQQSKGWIHWMHKSVAKPVARKSRLMTLLLPKGVNGFVSEKDGSVSLKHIVIPVSSDPQAQPALQAAARLVQRLHCKSGQFTIIHVGEDGQMPTLRCPSVPGWTWTKVTKQGNVTKVILDTIKVNSADLLVMTTGGKRGFLDALQGGHTEQILKKVPCPLLTIPAGSWMASVLQSEAE